jgi:putative nucleotidyltransferase with HDIG domain
MVGTVVVTGQDGQVQRDLHYQLMAIEDHCTIPYRDILSAALAIGPRRVLIDVNLNDRDTVYSLQRDIKKLPRRVKTILAINRGSKYHSVMAERLGVDGVVTRPFQSHLLQRTLFGIGGTTAIEKLPVDQANALSLGDDIMRGIDRLAQSPSEDDLAAVNRDAVDIVGAFDRVGLESWFSAIRQHHNATFQHCLLVTGVAVGLARHLGFRETDVHRLTIACLLHDIGKANIPLSVLDKPGALDPTETMLMRQHPAIGASTLGKVESIAPEILDVVLGHHGYLDGSGYPHGRAGREISDIVRLCTICDIYAALVERRSYKQPVSQEEAYGVLLEMRGKLDMPIVKAFKPLVARGLAA